MNAIKVIVANSSKIESALAAVNGRAALHAYTTYTEIASLAAIAEDRVVALVGTKKDAVGAKFRSTSGSPVSNAYAKYNYTRQATFVELQRRPTGWFLVDTLRAVIWQRGGAKGKIVFTSVQFAAAVKQLTMMIIVEG